jgi:hypothetical protein
LTRRGGKTYPRIASAKKDTAKLVTMWTAQKINDFLVLDSSFAMSRRF